MAMAMATAVIIVNSDGPWSDDDFAIFFVVALAVAGGVSGFGETHIV